MGMNATELTAAITVSGVIVGASIGFWGNVVNNWVLLTKEREQRKHDREVEHSKREYERELEDAHWRREQIQTGFQNCIYHLGYCIKVSIEQNQKKPVDEAELLNHFLEAQKSAAVILSSWSDRDNVRYRKVTEQLPALYGPRPEWSSLMLFRNALGHMVMEDDGPGFP